MRFVIACVAFLAAYEIIVRVGAFFLQPVLAYLLF